MKTVSKELLDLLRNSDEFLMADLYTFTLADGTSMRYTSADVDVNWHAYTFDAHGLIITRESTRITRGLEVDSNSLTITADPAHKLQGLPWPEAALGGVLDGARCVIERAFFKKWPHVVGSVVVFSGRVSDVSGSRTTVQVTVKSDIELLNVASPRNIYQAGCLRSLYDDGCGVQRERFTANGSVLQSSDGTSMITDLGQAEKWFEQGVVVFTSGANVGLRRTVKTHGFGGRLEFSLRLPHVPQMGDTFQIYPGCDKRKETCHNKFNNLGHFRGFPYIPIAEAVT